MTHYQPNIHILCKIVKKEDGFIQLVELGEFPLSHNPEEMMKKLHQESEDIDRFMVLEGFRVYHNNTFG